MAQLTTHVIDTSRGVPADGVRVELHRCDVHARQFLATATTGIDGRTDSPFASGDMLGIGWYELTFHVGDYFRRTGVILSDPPFLDAIVVRVGLADTAGRYHIP